MGCDDEFEIGGVQMIFEVTEGKGQKRQLSQCQNRYQDLESDDEEEKNSAKDLGTKTLQVILDESEAKDEAEIQKIL